jgi:2-C-methyl-D-erythritol 4-phosphate cytidylyltransferase
MRSDAIDVVDGARSRQRGPIWVIVVNESHQGAAQMQVTTIGLNIAKNVFQVHAIDTAEKVVVRKQLRRSQVPAFFERALLHSTSRWVFRCSNCAV